MSMIAPSPKHPHPALKPFQIGPVRVETPLTLAPMAGQTAHPFRVLCRQMGSVGLVCTELLSSVAMHYGGKRNESYLDWTAAESPIAVQLYGSNPQMMAEAARMVVDLGADIVDINMGCWVPKVAKSGAGAALLRDVCTATQVVEAVVKAVSVPVTVKVRAGWDAHNLTAVPFARSAENAGVQAIAVHGRTAAQGFTGKANWDIIRQVKETVRIPVIGNGDVSTPEDTARMFEETGCDGVMIGRAALGNPWLFGKIAHYLRTGESLPDPTPVAMAAAALFHARLAVERSKIGERHTVLELRGQLTKYHLGTRYAAVLRQELVKVETLAQIEALYAPLVETEAVA